MSMYDTRLDALETDAAMMKRDIVYKLDDTNSTITILRGVMGSQGRDIAFLINLVRGFDLRLDGVELDVRAIKAQQDVIEHDISAIKAQQDVQGNDISAIKHSIDTMEGRFNTMEGRFDTMEGRFDTMEGRFDTMEKKFDQVLSLLTAFIPEVGK